MVYVFAVDEGQARRARFARVPDCTVEEGIVAGEEGVDGFLAVEVVGAVQGEFRSLVFVGVVFRGCDSGLGDSGDGLAEAEFLL